jgi:hypothetical protein
MEMAEGEAEAELRLFGRAGARRSRWLWGKLLLCENTNEHTLKQASVSTN